MVTVGGRTARLGVLACISVLAALGAAGCTGSSATPQTILITLPPAPSTPLPPGVTAAPTVARPSPIIDSVIISSNAPDNRWTVTFKKPVVSGISADAAAKMNDAISNLVNGYISAFTGSGLPAVAVGVGPSTLEGDFSIALTSPTLLSLRFTMLTYTSGGAHPVGQPGSANFVVSSGAAIKLTDILNNPATATAILATQAHAALAASLGSDLTWSGSATSIGFFDKAWSMSPAGLEFTWAQGQLASQAAGMPSATLAWSAVKPIIKSGSPAAEFV